MNYIFRQHYTLPRSDAGFSQMPVVLLAEPEAETLAVYARHLTRAQLSVNVCMELSLVLRQIREVKPHLLIINPMPDLAPAINLLRQVAETYPGLPIITIGLAIPDPYLDRLMAAGVTLHINRTLTRPPDIAIAARQILGLI
jgi:hypothetical protein